TRTYEKPCSRLRFTAAESSETVYSGRFARGASPGSGAIRMLSVMPGHDTRREKTRKPGRERRMRIVVIGSGGREHALGWAIAASPLCDRLYCAPGNPGIADVATCVPIGAMQFEELLAFARAEQIDFVVVGPEAPLVAGLADRLEAAGIAT